MHITTLDQCTEIGYDWVSNIQRTPTEQEKASKFNEVVSLINYDVQFTLEDVFDAFINGVNDSVFDNIECLSFCYERNREIVELLDSLKEQIKEHDSKEYSISFDCQTHNTGLTQIPVSVHSNQLKYGDLGGKSFNIRIDLPNTKTLEELIKDE